MGLKCKRKQPFPLTMAKILVSGGRSECERRRHELESNLGLTPASRAKSLYVV